MPIEFSAESPLTRGIAYDSRRFAWILVPLHSSRRVTVSGTAGMTPFRSRLEDELLTYHVAGINFVEHGSGDRRVLEIRGTRPGLAAIDYAETPPQGRDQDNPRLIVSVKRKRLINAAFHYVKGGIWQRTHRKPNQLDSLLNGVNRILEPQANVRVVCKSRRWLPTRPLGFRVIETPKKYEHGRVVHRGIKRPERFAARRERAIERAKDDQRLREYSYLKGLGDPHADLNVFFVRRAQSIQTGTHSRIPISTRSAGPLRIRPISVASSRVCTTWRHGQG